MKKFRLFKLILLTIFVFKILLISSLANYDLETESKIWEKLDKNLKEKKQEEKKQKEQEEQRLKQAQDEQKQKVQEKQRQKEQEEQRLKQAQEEQKLKQAQEEQKQKERDKEKVLLSKLFPKNETSIVAKIDNKIITSYDLEIEIKYLQALSPNIKNLTKEQKINSAKESLIREKIKLNEILKYYKFGKDTNYLNKIVADTYKKLGLKSEPEFVKYLSNYDLTIDDIKKKIEIEIVWNKLIFEKYNNKVEIDVEKLKKKINEAESKLNKQEEFLLSEIVLSAENKEELDKKYKKILKSIEDVGFKNTASIYSISDTAKFGGSIGWVQGSQLSELVINELQNMNPGETTKPIDVPGGLLIIKIDEKKMRKLEINFDLELKKMIQYEKNKKLSQFSLIYYKKIKNSVEIYEN